MSDQLYYEIKNDFETFADTKKQESSGLYLQGNLKTEGDLKAKSFYLSDGTKLPEVKKFGLPKNITKNKKNIGINQKNPRKALDIIGGLGVKGRIDLIGNANLGKKICFINPKTKKKICIDANYAMRINKKIDKIKKMIKKQRNSSNIDANNNLSMNKLESTKNLLGHLNKHHAAPAHSHSPISLISHL